MTEMMEIDILRYRPEEDNEPFYQTYKVPYEFDMSVLEALQYVKDHLDSTLSFRWSCRMAICGSCGMMLDDTPKLACKTFLRDYYPKRLQIAPLDHFPIERDLVVVLDDFISKLEKIDPYIVPKEEKLIEEGEFLQKPAQLERFRQYSMCINCLLCYAACPQYGLNNDFYGPAVLSLLHRYNKDSRDNHAKDRIDRIASQEEATWSCTLAGVCSDVCPKDVDPASAIQQLKVDTLNRFMVSVFSPKKIKERS